MSRPATGAYLKILSVVTQLEAAGAQVAAVALHRSFRRRGTPSELVFLYEKSPFTFPDAEYAILCKQRPGNPIDYGLILRDLRRFWLGHEPTHIFAHTHYAIACCAILKAAGLPGHLVAVHHNVLATYPWPARVMDYLAGTFGRYKRSVAVSEAAAASFTWNRWYRSRMRVVPNGHEVRHSILDKASARAKFHLPARRFILGNVGRLAEQKNQRFLIELMPSLPEMTLAIVGDGPCRGEFSRQIDSRALGERVLLLGTMPHDDIPDFLRAVDVFVFPSLHEGRSMALLEAMAGALPIVAHDTPTVAATLKQQGLPDAGIVLPLESEAWANTLRRLAIDPDAAAALGSAARMHAGEFNVDHMTDAYLGVLSELK